MIQDYNKFPPPPPPGVFGASRAGGGACMKHRFFVLSSSFFVCAISPAGVVTLAIGDLRITTPGANIKAATKAARTSRINVTCQRCSASTRYRPKALLECGGLIPLWYCVPSASLFGAYSVRHPTDNVVRYHFHSHCQALRNFLAFVI